MSIFEKMPITLDCADLAERILHRALVYNRTPSDGEDHKPDFEVSFSGNRGELEAVIFPEGYIRGKDVKWERYCVSLCITTSSGCRNPIVSHEEIVTNLKAVYDRIEEVYNEWEASKNAEQLCS